ncbi:MAG: hypothetical protein B7X50_11695 [Alishewanella sp. 34-51-39]|uniref:hypothetical protein n=1 Tax=Alishewanella sp. BS5-314 TaxID=2755587 RepID=UPI000BC38DD3|nr:hypothetical protein [Alishewanella sp. BS5-314]MCT8125061.1 hypothetical protein [Alishewanella sp. BS5-314]OZB38040.1 MAG: hypothetical protein B7X50_11695 [Alishewanella sp. 34-51-39]
MTSPFVLTVHKNFAVKLKEAGCDPQQIASHLQEVLLEDEEITQIIQELSSQPERFSSRQDFA